MSKLEFAENIKMKFSNMKYYVNPFDILKSKILSRLDRGRKIRVGWCAPFPPQKNGAATATYWFVKELCKYKNLEVYALPFGRVIDKKLFLNVKYTSIFDKKLDFIIFFCMGLNSLSLLGKVSSRTKTIALQTAHLFDSTEQSEWEYKILRAIDNMDYIFAVTKYGQKFYSDNLKRKIEYIPCCVDTSKFDKMGKRENDFTVLFQSRFCYYKGIKQFLESIPFVLKKYPNAKFKLRGIFDKSDLHFIYKGDNRKIYSETVSLLNEFKEKYPDNLIYDISWYSPLRVNESYKGVDVLVFPSNNEGFGIPIIEAMSCEIPVIALDKKPMNEFISNGKNGFLIKSKKNYEKQNYDMKFPYPKDIASKIVWMIENPKKVEKMGVEARKSIVKNYDLKKVVGDLVNLIIKLKNENINSK